jgi:thiamine-monophosphate kinase
MDERALIGRVGEIIGPGRIADDCAVLPLDGDVLVLSTDMLHEKADFPGGMTDWQIGWMAAAVTLSDIAAMGARPVALLLAVGLDRWERLEGITAGAAACTSVFGCELAGGDTDAHTELTVVSSGVGRVAREHLVRRTGSAPGDLVCITGTPGCAQAGLAGFLQHQRALLEPQPQVAAGTRLGAAGATAMMDVSDGLVISLYDLLSVNTCGYAIDSACVPLPGGVPADEAQEYALYGGGDFGLLFTIPPERFPVEGVEAAVIGRAIPERRVLVDGEVADAGGYQHRWGGE